MKLLIIDDEKLTREGIEKGLDLEKLGISQVFLADDGVHGFQTALEQKPDIILTDVRMPRMNGVEMAEKILKELPSVSIIFMSAYSDKEYLKAAIKLKALGYVEKPLDMEELSAAIWEAVVNCRREQRTQSAVQLQKQELKNQLCHYLTQSSPDALEKAETLNQELGKVLDSNSCICCLILDCIPLLSSLPEPEMYSLRDDFNTWLEEHHIFQAHTFRGDHRILIFLVSQGRPAQGTFSQCAQFLSRRFQNICPFFIALGPEVCKMDRAWFSYEEACEYLKGAFFYEYGFLLTSRLEAAPFQPPADLLLPFSMALAEKDEEQVLSVTRSLLCSIIPSPLFDSSQIKDLYYRYFSKLDEHGLHNYISLWQKEGLESESIWEGIMRCHTLSELDHLLTAKIRLFFQRLKTNSVGNPVVFQIKEYIHKHYAIPSLSVPDVSEYVRLSSSYVCTIFKNETGQTLNQYLTDYRIKMSKQFLSDPRYKIADISSKVGYSDGNYYSKTFKKIVGLSPSEYRDKMALSEGNPL